jgi:creatinine amidohydrolase/Fe(II)-dependent formamide hydrolase-like protein
MNTTLTALTILSLVACACTGTTGKKLIADRPPANILQLKELNTAQLESLDKNKTVIVMPGGILEEHGPYLPSFTDGYWNERLTDTIASAIAAKKGWNVVLFPTIPLGNSGANDVGMKYSFPGTYSVRFETLRAVFMDLATELGEQGFKYVFIIHGHGAPNHQRALDQAADYFNETYRGRMVNLMGLNPVVMSWFEAPKTKGQSAEDGFTIHAGMAETSSMLYLAPHLVNGNYKNAVPFTGNNMEELVAIAQKREWKGYFGSERLATAEYGKVAWNSNSKMFTKYVLDILDNRINLDTVLRFSDYSKGSAIDVTLDSLSLGEEERRKEKQQAWLQQNGLK